VAREAVERAAARAATETKAEAAETEAAAREEAEAEETDTVARVTETGVNVTRGTMSESGPEVCRVVSGD